MKPNKNFAYYIKIIIIKEEFKLKSPDFIL